MQTNKDCRLYLNCGVEPLFITFCPQYSRHSVLPIVMGARPQEYEKVAPYNSFIHVDQFKGPKELAEYLLELDKDDKKYNQYFQVLSVVI